MDHVKKQQPYEKNIYIYIYLYVYIFIIVSVYIYIHNIQDIYMIKVLESTVLFQSISECTSWLVGTFKP